MIGRYLLLLLTASFFVFFSHGQKTIISGSIKNLPGKQSINCGLISGSVLEDLSIVIIPVTEGNFNRQIDIKKTTFLSFAENENYYAGFIEPGDSIVIAYDVKDFQKSLSFSGKGKEKFLLIKSINKLRNDLSMESKIAKDKPFPIDYYFTRIDSAEKNISVQLSLVKPSMSKQSFEQVCSYLASTTVLIKYNGVQIILGNYTYEDFIKEENLKLTAISKSSLHNLFQFTDSYSNSFFYVKAVYNLLSLHYENDILPKNPNHTLTDKYNCLSTFLHGSLKAPVLYLFLKNEIKNINDAAIIDPVIQQSFQPVKDTVYKNNILKILASSRKLKPGSEAPDFSLEDTSGKKVSLASFKGKVIYVDFWFAACTPCHALLKEISGLKEYFKKDSVVFLTISVDSKEVWEKSLLKFNIQGYHVFTENKFRSHPIIAAYNVLEYPSTFIIDRKGIINNITPSHNAEELKKEIEAVLLATRN